VSDDSPIDILSLVRGTNDELMQQSKQWNLARLPDLERTQSHRESVGERNADEKSLRSSTRTTDRLSGSRRSNKGELQTRRTHRAPISGPALEATVVHSAASSPRTGADASDTAGPEFDIRELMGALNKEQSRQQRDEVLDIGQETCDSHPNSSEPEAEADLSVTTESVLRQWHAEVDCLPQRQTHTVLSPNRSQTVTKSNAELTTSEDSAGLREYELVLQRLHDEMEAMEATAQENEILRKQLSKAMTLLETPQQGSRAVNVVLQDLSTSFDATSAATARQAMAAVVTANPVMPSPHRIPPDFMSSTRRCSVGTQLPCNASPAPVYTHRQLTRLVSGSRWRKLVWRSRAKRGFQ